MDIQSLTEAFELIDTWEGRFELISDLGRELIPIAESERVDDNLVPGCDTRTWLTGSLVSGEPSVLEYRADAETPLVRGLVAVLLMPFQGKTPEEVLETDPARVLGPLHLDQALSAKRQAGMEAFLDRVRRIARRHSNW